MVNGNTLKGKEIPRLEDTLGCGCKGDCKPCICAVKDKASAGKSDAFNVYDKARLALGADSLEDNYIAQKLSELSLAKKAELAIGAYD